MRLEKSVSKMGLRYLRCWTKNHFIKKHWNFRRETRISRVRIFQIFENLDSWRFDPMILCSFLWRFRWKTLESHNSKQVMVYEQITFFRKNRNVSKKLTSESIFQSKYRFSIQKTNWKIVFYKKSNLLINHHLLWVMTF